MEQVNLRQGFGEDKMKFVTPDDPSVSLLVIQVTGGWSDTSNWNEYWSDVKRMYDWVVDNIKYAPDSPSPVLPSIEGSLSWRNEFWRFPNETIRDKAGDCEDMANLLVSMIRNYGHKRYAEWSIVIEFEKDSNTEKHVAVAMPCTGSELVILDPAGKYYTRDELGNLVSKKASEALQDWFNYWETQGYRNPKVICIFSDYMYKEFSSNEEFINYVRSLT